jgi:hypothetical protein
MEKKMPKSAAAKASRNLGLGYSLPIIGGATALIFGLMVYDIVRTQLDIWIWVIIQVILGASLVWGTRASTQSYNHAVESGKKLGAARGARNLNFVLGIVWSGIVTIMSFSVLAMAIGKLHGYSYVNQGQPAGTKPQYTPTGVYIKPFTVDNFFGDFLPAFLLLLILLSGIFLLMSERNTEKFLTLAQMRVEWDKYRAESKALKVAKAAGSDSKPESGKSQVKE